MTTQIICDTASPVMPRAYARAAGTLDEHGAAEHTVIVATNRAIRLGRI